MDAATVRVMLEQHFSGDPDVSHAMSIYVAEGLGAARVAGAVEVRAIGHR